MALKKRILDEKGAVATYHRINNVNKNYNKIIITVASYTDESYREIEKEVLNMTKERNNWITRLSILSTGVNGIISEEAQAEINELNEKMDKINTLMMHGGNYYIFTTDIEFESADEESVSFEDAYNKLINESEMFKDAESDAESLENNI